MKSKIAYSGIALMIGILSAGAGCATTAPPRELVDAREAMNRAKSGPASEVAPADLYTAQKALQRAEDAYNDDATAASTRDLAYVAHRKVLFAEAQGNIATANKQKAQAAVDYQQASQQKLTSTQQQLNMTQKQLEDQKRNLETEQKARADAEAHARDAIAKMAGMAAMKQEARGLVITLSGSVLFASNKSDLLPTATPRLGDLVKALKEDDKRAITVVGHTDAQGDDGFNMTLSQKRAESVRNFLVSQGIESTRVKAVGMGKAQPIADNGSPEGRANNRRVEVVLENTNPTSTDSEGAGDRVH